MTLTIGDSATLTKTITENDVKQFADLIGDHNPVHLDEDFAKKTRFGQRIVHGMLGASLISAALATKLPGPGTVYLSQSLRFEAPIFLGDTIKVRVTVVSVRQDKPIVTLETVCENQDGRLLVRGEAVVLMQHIK